MMHSEKVPREVLFIRLKSSPLWRRLEHALATGWSNMHSAVYSGWDRVLRRRIPGSRAAYRNPHLLSLRQVKLLRPALHEYKQVQGKAE